MWLDSVGACDLDITVAGAIFAGAILGMVGIVALTFLSVGFQVFEGTVSRSTSTTVTLSVTIDKLLLRKT